MPKLQVIVIGAGIIGTSTALALQSRGLSVTLLSHDGSLVPASSGNAGAFAFSDIVPLATPGIMRKAPKWLLDPLGPLSVPPAYSIKIAPWMLRFWRASWQDRFEDSLKAQSSLMSYSRGALERQILAVNGEALIQRNGQLQLFEGEAEFQASLPMWRLRKNAGIRFDLIRSPEEIAAVQPGIDARFTHAGFTPDWINTCDPDIWMKRLAQVYLNEGGNIKNARATALEQCGSQVAVTTSAGPLSADRVVISAGAWSHHLARTLGDKIPLETERGYNTTLPKGSFELATHLTFGGHGFVVTRINGGVRVGGAVELGGLNLPPDFNRARVLLEKAARFLPGLKLDGGTQWMGFRPSMPDSLPVIGASARADHVIYAFGHGHLGLTQSAGTAELVSDLIEGKATSIDLSPFAADRF